MRMWNAFHGNSSCGNHVKRYVEDSLYNGVGENWLDEAYDWDWGSNNDDCRPRSSTTSTPKRPASSRSTSTRRKRP